MHGMTWQDDESTVSQVSMHPFQDIVDFRLSHADGKRNLIRETSFPGPARFANVLQRDTCIKIVLIHASDTLYYSSLNQCAPESGQVLQLS